MIDTIVLRIYDTQKYRRLIRSLDMLNVKGYTTESAKVNPKEVSRLRNQGVKDQGELLSILKMQRTGEFLVKTKVAKQMNASSHYAFAYLVNFTANYIEFNFSIPKYTYGSNVLMFVEHLGDKDYTFHYCSELEHNIERAFTRLEKFLKQFVRMEFSTVEIDRRDVEVHRIDVCFNQLFRSKSEALKYLEYQKRKRKKYSRNEEGVMKDYETSLMYVTQRYSAKIYHKGTEYAKNDLREHQKINKEKGQQYFKTEQYQALADRILRYELTIRNGMLNYLHKQHVFRKHCPYYQEHYKVYQEVEASIQRNDRISKKLGTLEGAEKEAYRKAHPYDKIDKEKRKVYKYVSKLINKRTYFTFSVDSEHEVYNKQTVHYDSDKALFSKGLLKLCLEKLVEFIQEYQVAELPLEDKIEKLIEDYNFRHKKKLPKSEMLNFYKDLQTFGSFKETAKFCYLSRTSLYRYKERFKKIGITENNLIPLTEDGIPRAPLDFRDYHLEHQFNAHFLNKNSFLDLL